ncbi:MAG: DUF2330 domain-containing protein, partial [Planctomycetes bacterium]|nr:DUF2330 domain-containing protein [Planctomycetota bacterium]
MNRRISGFIALAVTIVAVSLPTSDACAPAPPRNVIVEIASESAIIVWDSQNKMQHFIRRAAFNAKGTGEEPVKDFGFIVPTPTQPTLEEADDKAFSELATITAPKTETKPRPSGGGCGIGCAG